MPNAQGLSFLGLKFRSNSESSNQLEDRARSRKDSAGTICSCATGEAVAMLNDLRELLIRELGASLLEKVKPSVEGWVEVCTLSEARVADVVPSCSGYKRVRISPWLTCT